MLYCIAAKRVLDKRDHQIGNCTARAVKPQIKFKPKGERRVVVKGITPSQWNFLEIIFEDKKKSGGGQIEKIDKNDRTGSAVITYASSDGMFCYNI